VTRRRAPRLNEQDGRRPPTPIRKGNSYEAPETNGGPRYHSVRAGSNWLLASSHREAPISALDHSADVTDWYALSAMTIRTASP